DGDWRQVHAVRDIADRVDVRYGGLRVLVNGDAALLAQPHPRRLHTETGNIRPAANREHHLVDFDRAVVGKRRGEGGLRPAHRAYRRAAKNPHAPLGHLRIEVGAQVVVEAAQDVFAAVDQRNLGPEPIENGGELDGDIAAALNQDARRQFFQMKRLIRGDDVFEARDRRPHPWRSAGCDQNMARPDLFSGRDETHRMCVFQYGTALDDFNAGTLERRGI